MGRVLDLLGLPFTAHKALLHPWPVDEPADWPEVVNRPESEDELDALGKKRGRISFWGGKKRGRISFWGRKEDGEEKRGRKEDASRFDRAVRRG